jgi:hypothetical protein
MKRKPLKDVVVVHYDRAGNVAFHVAGKGRLLVVDERCPGDRVYECLARESIDVIKDIMGDDDIGSMRDAMHEEIVEQVVEALSDQPTQH